MRRSVDARRASVALLALLFLVVAWTAVGDGSGTRTSARSGSPDVAAVLYGRPSLRPIVDAIVLPVVAAARSSEPWAGPLGLLPALVAALLSLHLLGTSGRRADDAARRWLRCGHVGRRAPPAGSFA
jgi:hypothetical protein